MPGFGSTSAQPAATGRPASLPGLTGLRGIGAIWVVIFHAQYGMNLPVAKSGYLGVDLFFVLSGFVLSHAHPETRWDWARYRAFLQTRFARIFPMHWAALAFLAALLVVYPKIHAEMADRFRWPELISSSLLMQNWGWGRPGPWNVPAWSLSTEWLVSIGFPIFLVSARRVSRPVPAALFCCLCLVTFAVFLAMTDNPDPAVVGRAGIVRTICEFAAGCMLYRIHSAGTTVSAGTVLAGAMLIAAGVLVPALPVLAVFGFPVIILSAAQPSSPLASTLSTPVMVFLGEISYSVYLLHWILLQVSERLQERLDVTGATALLWFLCFLALLIALSAATYRWIEVPCRRLLRPRPALRIRTQSRMA